MKTLIKVGGTLVDDGARLREIARQIAGEHHADNRFAVVHGGGKQLTRFLEERGVVSRFVGGLRVTTEESIDAVVKVLAGAVNMDLVGALRAEGASAVGLSGMDGRLTTVTQLDPELGRVGRIASVDPRLLDLLTLAGSIPVVACIGGDDQGRAWNVNADQMAAACAVAFPAERLIFLTDVAGVMDGEGKVLEEVNLGQIGELIARGVARGGMQAKLEAAAAAIRGGVGSVVIASGTETEVLRRVLGGERVGTEIHS